MHLNLSDRSETSLICCGCVSWYEYLQKMAKKTAISILRKKKIGRINLCFVTTRIQD